MCMTHLAERLSSDQFLEHPFQSPIPWLSRLGWDRCTLVLNVHNDTNNDSSGNQFSENRPNLASMLYALVDIVTRYLHQRSHRALQPKLDYD